MLIVGGGIAGLGLSLALARRGIGSRIIERRATFSEAGAGIQISPNGVRALEDLGIRAALEPLCGRPQAIHVHGANGSLLQRLPLGAWIEARHGAPYLVAHRRDLQAALLDAVRRQTSIEISTGFEVAGFATAGDGVTLTSSIGSTVTGRALVGADGVFSCIRAHLHAGFAPRFAGRTAARAILDTNAVAGLLDPAVTGVWLARDSHVVHYPVRGGREIAVVMIRTETWADSGAEIGWSAPLERAALAAALEPFAPRLQQALATAQDWRRWALFEAPPLPAAGLGSAIGMGRVTQIGDAAHPILPFLAQGGALALEDAVTLANALATHGDDVAAAFRAHERLRWPRTIAIARAAKRNGWIYHLGGFAARGRDTALRHLPPERIMAGYDWIYGWRP